MIDAHPIEHLRHVARAEGADPALVAREAAWALAEIAGDDPAGLVPACRRLVGRHLSAGPVWWLSARVLAADDPAAAAGDAARELDRDQAPRFLADTLPDDATVLLLGGSRLRRGLRSRGDLEILVADEDVPASGIGAAAAVATVVVADAHAAGPGGLLAPPGALSAAAVAAHLGVEVWGLAGTGVVLPERLWDALLTRLDESGREPWERDVELVPGELLSRVVGAEGAEEPGVALRSPGCAAAPELLKAPE